MKDDKQGRKLILLWGAWYGSKNVGDQALLLAITDMLGGEIAEVEFVVITANPAHVREYTSRDSPHRFRALHGRRQFLEVVRAFASADVFILGGGVPFYDDLAHSMTILLLAVLARIFKVPAALWAVSSLKIRSAFTKWALRYLLAGASVTTCRDGHTYDLLRECGANEAQLMMVADSVFAMLPGDVDQAEEALVRAGWRPDQARPLVALTPRTLRGGDGEAHTHYTPRSDFESEREVEVFAAVLDWLWQNEYQPVFIPMNTVYPDDDRIAARRIMEQAKFGKQSLIIDESIPPRLAAGIYSHCHSGFVARVHGSITAFLGRCPVMMYAFDLKHRGIMEQMGCSEYVFDPQTDTSDQAVEMMGTLLGAHAGLVGQMEEKHEGLLRQAFMARDAVLRLLKGQ